MSLSVKPTAIQQNYIPKFKANKKTIKQDSAKNQNPINRAGETMNLVKTTFIAGLALGGKLLYELCDNDFLFEKAGKAADKIVSKNHKNASAQKQILYFFGATAGLLIAGVGIFAFIYTLFNTPKIKYDGKVNTFTKTKEMDVFINSNEAEKNIYSELSQKAKSADIAERNHLKTQYMQMKMTENRPPEWVYNYSKKNLSKVSE